MIYFREEYMKHYFLQMRITLWVALRLFITSVWYVVWAICPIFPMPRFASMRRTGAYLQTTAILFNRDVKRALAGVTVSRVSTKGDKNAS